MVSYTVHELPAEPDFQTAAKLVPTSVSFGGKIELSGIDYGHAATGLQEPAAQLEDKWLPQDIAAGLPCDGKHRRPSTMNSK